MDVPSLVLAVASAWQAFSSQSLRPQSGVNAQPQQIARVNVALLHVTASIGVPSYSGHPVDGANCTDATRSVLPDAWRLANARAKLFAAELGVTIVRTYHKADLYRPAPPSLLTRYDCGPPKWPGVPVTESVSQTFEIRSQRFFLKSHLEKTEPPSQPWPFPVATFRPPVVPSVPRHADPIVVDAVGTARMPADRAVVHLSLEAPFPSKCLDECEFGPRRDEDIALLLNDLRKALPNAEVTTHYDISNAVTTGSATTTFHSHRAYVDVDVRNPASFSLSYAWNGVRFDAQQLGMNLRSTTIGFLDSCEGIEDAARRDAIERARAEASRQASGVQSLRLLFADEQPMMVNEFCGPILDPSTILGGDDGMVAPVIEARVPIRLEFVVRKAH